MLCDYFQVARDHVVKSWNFAENLGEVDRDYGSGYPNGNKKIPQIMFEKALLNVLYKIGELTLLINYNYYYL